METNQIGNQSKLETNPNWKPITPGRQELPGEQQQDSMELPRDPETKFQYVFSYFKDKAILKLKNDWR